jgi:hypothetical protein
MRFMRLASLLLLGALAVIATFAIWASMYSLPSSDEFINKSKQTQEAKVFLARYPDANISYRDFNDVQSRLCITACQPAPIMVPYVYSEIPNDQRQSARETAFSDWFEDSTLDPTRFEVACYYQLNTTAPISIAGSRLSELDSFFLNESCPA